MSILPLHAKSLVLFLVFKLTTNRRRFVLKITKVPGFLLAPLFIPSNCCVEFAEAHCIYRKAQLSLVGIWHLETNLIDGKFQGQRHANTC
jgi:hypothetical protein